MPWHFLLAIRHSFKGIVKGAKIDDELRRIMIGHTIERTRYGTGRSLDWRRDELKKIALLFSPMIV
ncbi:hypothetical protein [Ochrobactrum sp. EDr1-4]|uniref:hypothetical protein n=1 Tax=Ochrobactrum sp. EDr1-4 TaxID=3368622 RepID=UPI003BA19106